MTNPTWTTAVPDWQERIVAGQSLIPCSPLFPDEADAALNIMRDLRIVDAPGSPTMGDACRQWVFDFAASIFGAYDADTGRRLIRYFFLLVSKKNSKSSTAAAIMLTALLRNWRKSGEFLILAPTIEVAQNAFYPARDMIKSDDDLSALLHVNANTRTITHRNTDAVLKVVAADNETVSGKKAIGVLVEELWLFGKRANAENMLREATGGLASRPEGFVIYLSTQADDPPTGVFRQKLHEFRDIRDGEVEDPKSLGVLYEFPPAMIESGECRLRENFYITNPNLGVSVSEEYLVDEFEKAERVGEASVRGFLAKHLNVEIGLALRSDRWAGADYWEAAGDKTLTLESLLDRCDVAVLGVDGGGLDDLMGLAVLGRDAETREWLLWSHAWAHTTVLERRKGETERFRDFEAAGELTIVDEVSDDVEQLADIAEQVDQSGKLAMVGVDPAGIVAVVEALEDRGIYGPNPPDGEKERVVGVIQGGRGLMSAIKTLERKLADGSIRHADLALMAYAVGNAKVEAKGNAIIITKQAAGSAKIDPLMAAFDAVALMSTNPEAEGESVYESSEFFI